MSLLPIISMTLIMVGATVARAPHNINMIGESAGSYDYSDYNRNYQDNPLALKRAALLLDRIILEKAADNQEVGNTQYEEDVLRGEKSQAQNMNADAILSDGSESAMDLHRRGRANRSLYWRCYFNVVTCFKKK